MLTSLNEYFSATVLNGRVLHDSSFHSALQFLSTNISQANVATRLRCGGMFNCWLTTNLRLTNFEHQLAFGEVRDKSGVTPIFQTQYNYSEVDSFRGQCPDNHYGFAQRPAEFCSPKQIRAMPVVILAGRRCADD